MQSLQTFPQHDDPDGDLLGSVHLAGSQHHCNGHSSGPDISYNSLCSVTMSPYHHVSMSEKLTLLLSFSLNYHHLKEIFSNVSVCLSS